jgi:hypothetical protein
MDGFMDEMFEEVLAICLDRLADGDTVAACVAAHPEYPDLQPLLEIAAALRQASADDSRRTDRTPTWMQPRQESVPLRPTG